MKPAAFAIPGDMTQKTGGYIYEYELLMALRAAGRPVDHLQLPAGFPDPAQAETDKAIAQMMAVPSDVPLILDGLVFGSIDPVALRKVRAPILAMLHHPLGLETGLTPERSRDLLQREAENLKRACAVIVPSPHTARILVQDFAVPQDKITIALPGFRPADPVRNPQTPPLILAVGLLAERKGHDILVAALGQLRHLPWQAQIVGKTHDAGVEQRLRAQIAALNLDERITITGLLKDDEVIERYRAATIFALATRYEGYGIVFGEAMLHGLPIVTCRTGAVPETIAQGAGLLVPVDDVPGFAQAIESLLIDQDLRDRMAKASAKGGQALPRWSDTASIVGSVLDATS